MDSLKHVVLNNFPCGHEEIKFCRSQDCDMIVGHLNKVFDLRGGNFAEMVYVSNPSHGMDEKNISSFKFLVLTNDRIVGWNGSEISLPFNIISDMFMSDDGVHIQVKGLSPFVLKMGRNCCGYFYECLLRLYKRRNFS